MYEEDDPNWKDPRGEWYREKRPEEMTIGKGCAPGEDPMDKYRRDVE